jgi:hypothetical protein
LTIQKHITLSYELGINHFQNINNEALDRNSADRYFTAFQCIKVGIIF